MDRRSPRRALSVGSHRRRQPTHRRGAGAPQRRRRTHRRCAARPRNPGRGRRTGRTAVDPRGRRRGGHAAPGCRPDGRCRSNTGTGRSTMAPRWPGYRRPVAARAGHRRQATPRRGALGRVDRDSRRSRCRHRVSGRRDQRSRPRWAVFGCGIPAYHRVGHRDRRPTRPPRSFPARPGCRGAPRAGRRLRSPRRSRGFRGLDRRRTSRRVRRRGGRLRRPRDHHD